MRQATRGWINGLIGVLIFSELLPATRVAVQGFDPVFLSVARATIAGLVGLGLLAAIGGGARRARTCRRFSSSRWAS